MIICEEWGVPAQKFGFFVTEAAGRRKCDNEKSQLSQQQKSRNKHVQIEIRVDPSRKIVFDLAFSLNINQD